MAVSLKIGKCSLIGNVRENNEDRVEVKELPEMTICIVADGMGGQAAGEEASKMATEVVSRELVKQIPDAETPDQIRAIIRRAIVQANEEIMTMGQLDRDLKNMGTTIVSALWLGNSNLYLTGLGDSRGYLIRDGKIEQLTTDHSLAQALVEARTISVEEAREHRFRNVLWKYLGTKEVGEGPEVKTLSVRPGDRFLLCTDGLSGVVPEDQLLAGFRENYSPQQCADDLCHKALADGSRDNISCVVIEVVRDA